MADTDATSPPPPTPLPSDASRGSGRDGHLVRSLAWVGGVRWGSQVVSWVSTMLVFRALAPSETGLVAMATSFLGLVSLLNEFGISGVILYAPKDLTKSQIGQINGLSLLIGFACYGLALAASGPVAAYYRTPEVQLVVAILGINFIISSFQAVPLALLRRELKFRSVAVNDAIQALVLAVVSVTLAYLGFGYWTLVIANLLGITIKSAAAVWRRPCPFEWPRFGEMRSMIHFGSHMTVSRLAWYTYSNADFWVVGRALGTAASGAYGLAWNLATMPVEKISSVVMSVAPAFLSSLNRNVVETRRLLLLIIEGTAILAMPATVGLAAVADVFVPHILGDKWAAAVFPLQVLAIYTTFRTITALLPPVMFSWGMAHEAMQTSVLAALVMPVAFIVGVKWGLAGIAVAWAVVYPLVSIPVYRIVMRTLEIKISMLLGAVAPAIGFTGVMLAAVVAVRFALSGHASPTLMLAAQVGVGVATYALCLRVAYWGRAMQIYSSFKGRDRK